jgi:hypothetical protein
MIGLREIGELIKYEYKPKKNICDNKLMNMWCVNNKDNLEKLISLGYRLETKHINKEIILVKNAEYDYIHSGDLHFYSNKEVIEDIKREYKEIVNFF